MSDDLAAATAALLHTVDGLPDDAWSAASVCEGWTRADVVAHLALNAEALAGVVRGLLAGEAPTMYRSDEGRDADIAELAAEPPALVRERLRSSAQVLAAAIEELPVLPAGATFERTPGSGRMMSAAGVPLIRLREVEIHHADLRAGYSYDDWPTDTAIAFLDAAAPVHDGPPVVVRATDAERTWSFGDAVAGAPVVTGRVGALAWWASGRDAGTDVTTSEA